MLYNILFFFFSSRRRHTRLQGDWSSDVCSSDLLTPRGWTPRGGTTSTLFIQTVSGDRHLRLDYGYNVKTQSIDYHWNVRKAASIFGVSDHAAASGLDRALYRGAKYFNHAG